jgi:D-glycero-alpha-D-manno-heptose-7-phosphate kinase
VAAKACGAGGGGCVVFLVKPGAKERVEAALRDSGTAVLPCRIAPHGLRVREYKDRRTVSAARHRV